MTKNKISPGLRVAILLIILALTPRPGSSANPATIVLEPKLKHLRNESTREWSFFPEQADAKQLQIGFQGIRNDGEFALQLRQQDVKQSWRVLLNDKPLGDLIRDEADILHYLPIPAGAIRSGENSLRIEAEPSSKPVADDIRVGELRIEPRSVNDLLAVATIDVRVQESDRNTLTPARITITTPAGTLQATSAVSSPTIAARPGVIYTADGRAKFQLPAGKFVLYASRGFEYSVARAEVEVAVNQTSEQVLTICREVQTPGMVSCDTHIHTFTHSGHGDATLDERLITLAGEAIELPIATDHNKHIDYRESARRLGLGRYFTPVTGNEVTTPVGHFNMFPVGQGAPLPNHQSKEWAAIFREIYGTPGVRVAILNHARDIHSNTRPFGGELFNPVIGENFAGWPLEFNAMEVVNSGAVQTDPLQLPRDWLALLNRGYRVTPVGSSDSHDVSRYIVGQGRTYIRSQDENVGELKVSEAVTNFLQGRVVVSYGLYVDLQVNDKFQPGDLAAGDSDEITAKARVLGPHWTAANKLQLYLNGQLLRETAINTPAERTKDPGVQWHGEWQFPRPPHDAHLVAIALGEGIAAPYWATAKPYQPTSPEFKPYTLSVTGPVWIDGDRNARYTSPHDYAVSLFRQCDGDLMKLVKLLAAYDTAIAAQATHQWLSHQTEMDPTAIDRGIESASPAIATGMRSAWQAWRMQQLARAKQ